METLALNLPIQSDGTRPTRQEWQEPLIILERLLEIVTQGGGPPGGPPGNAPYGFLGPLSGSQYGSGGCL